MRIELYEDFLSELRESSFPTDHAGCWVRMWADCSSVTSAYGVVIRMDVEKEDLYLMRGGFARIAHELSRKPYLNRTSSEQHRIEELNTAIHTIDQTILKKGRLRVDTVRAGR